MSSSSQTISFNTSSLPLYQQVKEYILQKIRSGQWLANMKIESEAELVTITGASRMTVNRALRELTNEGVLVRAQGRGTFVAEKKPQAALFEISSIAQDIKNRGGKHSCEVKILQEEKARPDIAKAMGLEPYDTVFHSVLLHMDNSLPIQLSSRFINPAIAPEYLQQDFSKITPNEYLLDLVPISSVEHVVEALIPEAWIRKLLKINNAEPCLALHRKTWVGEHVATCSTFYYPGSRYSLGSTFTPSGAGTVLIS